MNTNQATPTPEPTSTPGAAAPPPPPAPESAEDRLATLVQRARKGDSAVREEIRTLLEHNPGYWEAHGDVARALEQLLIERIAGPDILIAQSIRRVIEKMKKELAGEAGSALERLLANRLVVAWLYATVADMSEAAGEPTGGPVAKYRLQRADSASRRLISAARALAIVRRLGAGVRVEITHLAEPTSPVAGRMNVTGSKTDPCSVPASVGMREQLKTALDAEVKLDRDVAMAQCV